MAAEGVPAAAGGQHGEARSDRHERERGGLGHGHHGHEAAACQLFGRESEATSNERPDSLIGNKEAVLGPSGYSSFAGRIRSRPGSAVTIPPATNDSPWRASTSSQMAACRVTEQSTSLTMPQCGSPWTTASSPKSLSSVTRMRFSFRAHARIAASPGSVGQSPTQATSWPESRSVVAA